MKPIAKVRKIARHFRKWAEANCKELGFGFSDCSGMCGHASYEIFDALRLEGFSVQFCCNDNHCFVRWYDENDVDYLVDVTATQFLSTLPKVIVRRFDNRPKDIGSVSVDDVWQIDAQAETPEEVEEILADWPNEQKPQQFQHPFKKLQHRAA